MAVVVHLVDPAVAHLRIGHVTWFVSGLRDAPWATFDPDPSSDGTGEAALCRTLGDVSIIRVDADRDADTGDQPERATSVRLWRGVTSSHDPYYTLRPNGDVVITDHFRSMMALLPSAERQPSEAATISHFVLRHVGGRATYSETIGRPGHGEVVAIDLGGPRPRVTSSRFDRLESDDTARSIDAYVDDLDAALSTVVPPLDGDGTVAMLSGGSDSTLVCSYLPTTPAITIRSADEQVHLGSGLISRASRALDIEPSIVEVDPTRLYDHLVSAIDERGHPPHFPQWVMLTDVFERPGRRFVIAERAGAYALAGGTIGRWANRFSRWPGRSVRPLVDGAARLIPRVQAQRLARLSHSIAIDPSDPHGWASRMGTPVDPTIVEAQFGRERIDAVLRDRLADVAECVDLLPRSADRYLRHLETARWLTFYNENATQFRQLALASGKSLVDPFVSRPVIDALLRVPRAHRYEHGGVGKYIPKRLLARRLPEYPTTIAKDRIELSIAESFRSGPLRDAWQRERVPDFFEPEQQAALRNRPSETSWTALTWSIWQRTILDRADLSVPTASVAARWVTHL